ncbi:MAG: 5-(carboxyamino)imidazole ribonucleotide synthase [Nitrospira sp.]|nr:5-(carboxyamino)imidazole ribonucleotide synthase [Nitrospira sp.]MDH4368398.1 5-(carboxyamino)imidazole ribonucleotide synthase [Nitrospira sp.]MDH5346289.1 5-(carboxyamino)imidazole ribonucleotide synthase [Nitrospira sp.]MDH5497315.1 5-(carboxyamino)imidazole ribonucleotide synthase [Nitrospira sp.]MDH5725802.1 5-(carboxyamino)imidazole ribonucleotide synthase [Nitrospira sp.]
MTTPILEPGSILGVLGGGQLGAMFATAARRMGYRVAVWDPDRDAPAHQLAAHSYTTPFSDPTSRERFASVVHAVTLEWENVPAELCGWLEERCRMLPTSTILRTLQDRIEQKQFLSSRQLSVPSFAVVESASQLITAVNRLGLPVVCKTAKSGYDGKGQWVLRSHSDVKVVEAILGQAESGQRWIVEQFIAFTRELSVLVVRNERGECRVYPAVENRHEQGILRDTLVPASIAVGVAEQAQDLALQAVAALQGIGVFCVELFHTEEGPLLINEIAPRPHNSGHYTLDVCTVSQFEQQVRVTCGLPLGEVRLLSPAVMVNLIGEEVRSVISAEACSALYSTSGAALHLYGKPMIRPGRKMGHVTFTAPQREMAIATAQQFVATLKKPV